MEYWIVIGLLLIVAEFIIPGFIVFFFGLGALATAVLKYFFPELPIAFQCIAFGLCSTAMFALCRAFMPKTFSGTVEQEHDLPPDSLEYTGKAAVVTEAIRPDLGGKVSFQDSEWHAIADMPIASGETVKILRRENLTLVVTSASN